VAKRPLVSGIKQAGLLTAIPFVLLVGPMLGYYLGTAIDWRMGWAPWGMGVGIAMGLIASARVTIQMIRQAGELNEDE
jgi:F0F1-type ATP synthase assembly protein I